MLAVVCCFVFFFYTEAYISLSLSSPPRRRHRQLCKEAGEKEWWSGNTGCPSSLPWEKAAKNTGFKRPVERNGV